MSLGLREIKARYKQTLFGIAWAIIQPVSLMIIFSVVFSGFAKLPTDGAPYPVFSYSTLIFWNFFATTFSQGTTSLVANANLVRKVYFPREICFIAIFFSALMDLVIAFLVLLGIMAYYDTPLGWNFLFLIPIFLVQVLFTIGLVSLTSLLHVNFRDIGHAVPLILQVWMFASPVVYPLSIVPENLLSVYLLNPLAVIMDSYRRVIVLGGAPDFGYLTLAAASSFAIIMLFYPLFKKAELTFADVL